MAQGLASLPRRIPDLSHRRLLQPPAPSPRGQPERRPARIAVPAIIATLIDVTGGIRALSKVLVLALPACLGSALRMEMLFRMRIGRHLMTVL